ncbi:hypothetical protein, partial [Candidatus Frankia nodulisporulans]|uniref:hypothetical protein n=1 Tax=Candidatus Frankia nodulisporulans TaxID=2060052 RepID=UPI001C2E78A5
RSKGGVSPGSSTISISCNFNSDAIRYDVMRIQAAGAAMALPNAPVLEYGWHRVDSWQPDLPTKKGLARLRELTREAMKYARMLASPR